jgi:hypothetical protein
MHSDTKKPWSKFFQDLSVGILNGLILNLYFKGWVLKLKSEKAQESVLFCLVRFKSFIDLIRHLTPTKEPFQEFENGWKEMG